MLNIRDPIVTAFSLPTEATTADTDDAIVTSVMFHPPTNWTASSSTRGDTQAEEYTRYAPAKADAAEHECESRAVFFPCVLAAC